MIAYVRKMLLVMVMSSILWVPGVVHADATRSDFASIMPGLNHGAVAINDVQRPQAIHRATDRRPQVSAAAATPDLNTAYDRSLWSDGSGEWRQVGRASWYGGSRWQGRLTSSGERYDERALTAAHATLPLGTRVRVTVHDSGRSVVVVVTDRPGTRLRIIDLSHAAAAELKIVDRGVATVSITRD